MQISIAAVVISSLLAFTASRAVAADGRAATARFPVTAFGAKGDGQTLNTRAIQSAIDRCAEAGGGTVVRFILPMDAAQPQNRAPTPG